MGCWSQLLFRELMSLWKILILHLWRWAWKYSIVYALLGHCLRSWNMYWRINCNIIATESIRLTKYILKSTQHRYSLLVLQTLLMSVMNNWVVGPLINWTFCYLWKRSFIIVWWLLKVLSIKIFCKSAYRALFSRVPRRNAKIPFGLWLFHSGE